MNVVYDVCMYVSLLPRARPPVYPGSDPAVARPFCIPSSSPRINLRMTRSRTRPLGGANPQAPPASEIRRGGTSPGHGMGAAAALRSRAPDAASCSLPRRRCRQLAPAQIARRRTPRSRFVHHQRDREIKGGHGGRRCAQVRIPWRRQCAGVRGTTQTGVFLVP